MKGGCEDGVVLMRVRMFWPVGSGGTGSNGGEYPRGLERFCREEGSKVGGQ
jgi:hypothetical protein